MAILREQYSFKQANMISESIEDESGKKLYLQGIFIQGGIKNRNQRIYPVDQIKNAVQQINERLVDDDVVGEIDHPSELTINLDRVSHKITKMWMEGNNGMGKLEIVPTPMGNIIKTLIESKIKLGVSSRGSGNVDHYGNVADFEIVTIDIVANPSAQGAYPKAIYESLNSTRGYIIDDLSRAVTYDPSDMAAQKYLAQEAINWIKNLK